MFRTVGAVLYGLLVDDGQLAIGALAALAITGVIAYAGGGAAHAVLGWALLAMVLALVVANLYRAGVGTRRRVSSARR
ncbi:MAG TPA: hypothetical protein VGR87_07090 [Candidatus Limnocylindria bacterium]|jgi:thiosulfate reductase cytochrome b subunit|nr:hypothetical protein [Candidatus Limnocylindria bacterium]